MAEGTVVVKPTATGKAYVGKAIIEKGAKDPRVGVTPHTGTPATQLLPLFTGGMLVAAELHDLPNPDLANDPSALPVPGYKMYSSASGYVWVPKAEGDAMFAPADELNPMVIEQALKQGLRVVVPLDDGNIDVTTTQAPGTFSAPTTTHQATTTHR